MTLVLKDGDLAQKNLPVDVENSEKLGKTATTFG